MLSESLPPLDAFIEILGTLARTSCSTPRSRTCSPQLLAAVHDLERPFCEAHAVKKGTAPGHLDRPTEFNAQLQADVLWLDLDEVGAVREPGKRQKARKIAILVMVDAATRYMAARTIMDEKGPSLQKVMNVHGFNIMDHHDNTMWMRALVGHQMPKKIIYIYIRSGARTTTSRSASLQDKRTLGPPL